MGLLIRKQKEAIFLTKIAKLAIIGFIISMASAFIDTIWAVYLDSFLNNISKVGFLSAFLTILSFLSYFLFIPINEKSNKIKLFSYVTIMIAITYILVSINKSFVLFILLVSILTMLNTLRATSFGIIIKSSSSEKNLSRNEGLTYTFMNLAWVIGPLIAGYIAAAYHTNLVFIFAAAFLLIGVLSFTMSSIKNIHKEKKTHGNLIRNLIDYFKDKDRVLAYILGGGVNFWWILPYLFIPLFIIRNGLDARWIGYFLFGVAIPLIFFEFTFAKLAGKIGFKKVFKLGYLIPCILSLICFFISNIYIIMFLLILASIGLAMIEPTTEAYFFDTVKKKQELRFYGPYNTGIEINNFLSKLLPSILLLFLPFKYIFIFFSLFMFIFFLLSFKIREVIEKSK